MAATLQNIDGITASSPFVQMMKRLQPDGDIKRLWERRFPLLARVSKSGDFYGSQMDVPLEHDHPFASRTFATAQTNRYPSSSVKYNLTRARDYGVGRLDAETMASSANDRGAFVKALAREQKNVLLTLQKRSALALYRNHGGAIGQIATGGINNGDGTNDRITLTNKSDVWNFSIGMSIDVSSTDGTSGAIRTVSTQPLVLKLDFDNGYVFVGSDIGTAADITTMISSTAAADYLFADGDFGASFRGLDSWVPLTAPSAGESFLGIDRSVNPQRLAGHRLNDTSLSIEESIQELAARIQSSGGGGDMVCYMHPMQVKQLALELDTKVVRDPGGQGKFGFSGLMCQTAAGDVEVLGDPACPEIRAYLLDMDTWRFHHLKGFPHLVEDEGLARTRVTDADQIEFRYRLWGNLKCSAPGRNGVFSLATAY